MPSPAETSVLSSTGVFREQSSPVEFSWRVPLLTRVKLSSFLLDGDREGLRAGTYRHHSVSDRDFVPGYSAHPLHGVGGVREGVERKPVDRRRHLDRRPPREPIPPRSFSSSGVHSHHVGPSAIARRSDHSDSPPCRSDRLRLPRRPLPPPPALLARLAPSTNPHRPDSTTPSGFAGLLGLPQVGIRLPPDSFVLQRLIFSGGSDH